MSKKTYYRQCRLKKGNAEQVSYIPEPFCTEGRVLRLRDDNGVWTDGWLVTFAGKHRVEDLPDLHKEIRGHRKATGDSEPA